ncbi:hypothetical protein L1857_00545 [Amycolatopsis thermalba]|uniref:Uncharacterized protein n=1 Tax=Amycolatopsis thermalba TaxID=944492 RepID=A0ABY4NQS2_9PSEU|nr:MULTISPECIES: hypothetical protein [Amycolatopsis]UQS21421.1 hypothetical protein L1857_00545 [Amycolatopsis thermalba]
MWPWVFLAVVITASALAVVITLMVTSGEEDRGPTTFTVTGTFTLKDGVTAYAPDGGDCQGSRGYSDISGGAQVTVYTSSGSVAAIGQLGPGRHGPSVSCQFDIVIPNVPTGQGPYQIEVSHRGKIGFSEQEANRVAISLGN